MIPLVGFLPARDERMLGTVKAIESGCVRTVVSGASAGVGRATVRALAGRVEGRERLVHQLVHSCAHVTRS